MARRILPLLVFLAASLFAEDGWLFPASPEPTPEETLSLEYTNRFRADPPADAERIITDKKKDEFNFVGVDWEMFRREIAPLKPVQPLVFGLELIAAARLHSQYMFLNGIAHDEDANSPGFTGLSFVERCQRVRYPGFPNAENLYRDAPGAWGGHIGFIVDYGDGPGGMQKGRSHRVILAMWDLKEVGIGVVKHGEGSLSVTQNFGERRNVPRMAGGVVYIDRNDNKFYDVGEGVGGVKVSASDGSSTVTWSSGAYTLDLRTPDAVTLTADFGGKTATQKEKAARANIKFDWIMPKEAVDARADQLIAAAAAVPAKNVDHFAAMLALHANTRDLQCDETRRQKIEDMTKGAREQLAAAQTAVIEGLKNFDPKSFFMMAVETRKPFRKTAVDDWFKEAEIVGQARRILYDFERNSTGLKVSLTTRRQTIDQIEALTRYLRSPDLRREVGVMLNRVLQIGK